MTAQNQEYLWIKDEDTGAILQREEIRIPKEVLENVLTKAVSQRLESLEQQIKILKESRELCVSNKQAKEIIIKEIENFKSAGIDSIDIIDLNSKTRLPISQINAVMSELESEGRVTEYGENN